MPDRPAGHAVRVAVLHGARADHPAMAANWRALIEVLHERGWVEGRNIEFHRRSTLGLDDQYPAMAGELVELRPDVIIASNSQATRAARQHTDTIPIVMLNVADPVRAGHVASLARPGGNITGVTSQFGDAAKTALQLIGEVCPGISRLALLWVPRNPGSAGGRDDLVAIAPQFGLGVEPIAVDAPDDLPAAFAAASSSTAEALIVHAAALLISQAPAIAALAIAQRLPTVTAHRQMAHDGLLLSYAPDRVDLWRHAADYADRILNGANPGALPVAQPTGFELVVNRKTARAIGLDLPPGLLARADEVID